MEGSSCKVIPINVGSGDSILVELHVNGGKEHYLIDGGPKAYIDNLVDCLRSWKLIKQEKKMEKRILKCNVIITHPDQDHVSGITALMKKYYIEGEIIITTAFYRKLSSAHSRFLADFDSELTLTHSPSRLLFSPKRKICWQSPTECCLRYVPHSVTCDDIEPGALHVNEGYYREQASNISSILTTVCKSYDMNAAVFTGDSFGDITLTALNLSHKHTQIFQVPHHGSKMNIEVDKEGTLSKCTKFYSSFTADVYFISGSDKIHPPAEVLSGILKAVYKQSQNAPRQVHKRIVLTSSRGLSAKKIIEGDLGRDLDYRTILQRGMKIFHVDDIGVVRKSPPYTTIRMVSDEPRVTNAIQWTPETYYLVKKDIYDKKECQKDVLGWTTSSDKHEIHRFYGMQLIEVPFHEEPWQGDHLQTVYIIKASLYFENYRQVLYLKKVQSAHNNIYEMFAYSSVWWTRKYVSRIFQLKPPTEQHPLNYYNHYLEDYIREIYQHRL